MAAGNYGLFSFDGTRPETTESLQRRKERIRALLEGASSRTPRNVGEGINALGMAIGGRIRESRLDRQEKAGREAALSQFYAMQPGYGQSGMAPSAPQSPSPEGSAFPSGFAPELQQAIPAAAEKYGVPAEALIRTAQLESGGRLDARNPNSSAKGPFQFIDKTAQQYGLNDPFDPAQSTDAAARLMRDNAEALRRGLGRDPSPQELYLAHQQGAGGALAMLKNPNAPAASLVGNQAVNLNGGRPGMTAGDFANKWMGKAGEVQLPQINVQPQMAQNMPMPGGAAPAGMAQNMPMQQASPNPPGMMQNMPMPAQQMGGQMPQRPVQMAQNGPMAYAPPREDVTRMQPPQMAPQGMPQRQMAQAQMPQQAPQQGQPQGPQGEVMRLYQMLESPYLPAWAKQIVAQQIQAMQPPDPMEQAKYQGTLLDNQKTQAEINQMGQVSPDTRARLDFDRSQAAQTEAIRNYQFYADAERQAGREPLSSLQYQQALKGNGTSLSVGPDGQVMFQQGGQARMGRDETQMGKELAKADAELLKTSREQATVADDLDSLATQMETVIPQVGYTGPGGDLYGRVDDALGVLPGDEGARGAFRSLAMESQLAMTQKTKGAITDREMGMFREAVPNLTQTPEGNAQIVKVMQGASRRIRARAAFFEEYLARNGSLQNAQAAWGQYMQDNPLLERGESGFRVLPPADFAPYLDPSMTTRRREEGSRNRTSSGVEWSVE